MLIGMPYLERKIMNSVTAPSTIIPPHPNEAVYREYTQPWLALSDDERAWAILAQADVYKRYCLAQKYGPQLYNYVTQGITL